MVDKEILQEMGQKIKKLRLEKGYSQEELAKKVGYTSRSTINKIEKGLVDIPQSKILELANILNTTPLYLLDWVESPTENILTLQKKDGQQIKYHLSTDKMEKVIKFINETLKTE